LNVLKFHPTVFAVGESYQIFIPVKCACLAWVKVGDLTFYDHSNGVLRSDTLLHKIEVPMSELDTAKKYTVCLSIMIERKPYFSQTGETFEAEYSFTPPTDLPIRIYQIADAHGLIKAPVDAAKKFEEEFGKIDVLVLNGDVIEHSGEIEKFDNFFAIASDITGGSVPTVFSRGNHDTRGIYAERLADYSPTSNGRSYYSFKLGALWGLVLDCGEDKADSHPEYGGTVVCEAFRREETEYIKSVIKNKKNEYGRADIKKRIIICHHPFTKRQPSPFNIEEDTYSLWGELMAKSIEPDVMMSGHLHKIEIALPGDEGDVLGHPCPVVIGSLVDRKQNKFTGCGLIFFENETLAVFSDAEKISKTVLIKKGND